MLALLACSFRSTRGVGLGHAVMAETQPRTLFHHTCAAVGDVRDFIARGAVSPRELAVHMLLPTGMEAKLAEDEEWGLLIPWRGSRGLGNQLSQLTIAHIIARIAGLPLNLTLGARVRGAANLQPFQLLQDDPNDPQGLLSWLLSKWPPAKPVAQPASATQVAKASDLCGACAIHTLNVNECPTKHWRELGAVWRHGAAELLQKHCPKREGEGLGDRPVVIHFRCGRILGADWDMGFLTLGTYRKLISSLGVPRRGIQLVSSCFDSGRQNRCALCETLARGVLIMLQNAWPRRSVELLWNRPVVDDFATLACSRATICTPSTFCLFASMLSNFSLLPVANVLFSGQAMPLGPSVRWFEPGRGLLTAERVRSWRRDNGGVIDATRVLEYLASN